MAEHRLVLGSQVQVLLGISADAARTRLRALRASGVLSDEAAQLAKMTPLPSGVTQRQRIAGERDGLGRIG